MNAQTRKLSFWGGFHGVSEISIRVKSNGKISKRVTEKLNKHFCGMDGCKCGGFKSVGVCSNGLSRDEYILDTHDGGMVIAD